MVQSDKQYDVREKEFGEHNSDPLHSWRLEKLRRKSLLHVHDFLTDPECRLDSGAATDGRLVLAETVATLASISRYDARKAHNLQGSAHLDDSRSGAPQADDFPSTELQFRIGV